MTEAPYDLPYARGLLARINALEVNGAPLGSRLILGRYNALQFFQQELLSECRDFSRARGRTAPPAPQRASLRPRVRGRLAELLGLVAGVLSAAGLILRPGRILVYSIDKCSDPTKRHDFRMDGVYRFLNEEGVPYTELLHTYWGPDFFRNLRRRGAALYIESFYLGASLAAKLGLVAEGERVRELDLSGFTREEAAFVRAAVGRCLSRIPRTELSVRMLSGLLRIGRVSRVLSIDDARHFFVLLAAARLAGIPAYAFQHAHFTRYNAGILRNPHATGELPEPDLFYVWSEYWRREYERLGGAFDLGRLVIAGAATARPAPVAPVAHEGLNVMVLYETDADKDAVKRYIEAILRCPGTRILFKVRPDTPGHLQRAEYGIEPGERVESSDKDDLLPRSDVVAGTYSTYLYHAVAAGRPVVLLKTSSDFGEGMLVNGLADELSLEGDFCVNLRAAALVPAARLAARRERLEGGAEGDLRRELAALIR